MEQQRDAILCAERLLLHTLGFHFHAEHPYKHLLRIVKQMSEEKKPFFAYIRRMPRTVHLSLHPKMQNAFLISASLKEMPAFME